MQFREETIFRMISLFDFCFSCTFLTFAIFQELQNIAQL